MTPQDNLRGEHRLSRSVVDPKGQYNGYLTKNSNDNNRNWQNLSGARQNMQLPFEGSNSDGCNKPVHGVPTDQQRGLPRTGSIVELLSFLDKFAHDNVHYILLFPATCLYFHGPPAPLDLALDSARVSIGQQP